jgi:hypothetical protein
LLPWLILQLQVRLEKNEAIARWIQGELLYQMAEREGLLKQKQYKTTLQKSERELAGALMIDKMIKAENIETDPKGNQNLL